MLRTGCRAALRLPTYRHNIIRPLSRTFATAVSPTDPNSPKFDQVTTLSNGIRVATEAVPGHFSGLGVYIDAGSRYEDANLRGVSHLIDRLAFKSTKKRTADSMYESIESLGGNILCASSRESIMYQSAVFNKDVDTTMGILAETILDPLTTEEEVAQQLETARYEIGEIWEKPELILPEILHATGYKNNTLGNPLLCPEERLSEITRDSITNYRKVFYQPERVVVAFAGVQHEAAVKLVEQYFGGMQQLDIDSASTSATSSPLSSSPTSSFSSSSSSSSSPKSPSVLTKIPFFKNLSTTAASAASYIESTMPFDPISYQRQLTMPSHYTGGQVQMQPKDSQSITDEDGFTHLYIAFEAPSIQDPDIYALATLQTLLGGGGSFSAGGPGKGMYSRLYTNVLNQYGWIESCVAFNHAYTDSGLFGIAASCQRNASHALVNVILQELANTFAIKGFNTIQVSEVERAKNQLRSSLLMNLESRMVELEDLGRQIQVHGRKIGAAEMCKKIEALTVDDIRAVARRVLTGKVSNVGGGTGDVTVVIQARAKDAESMGDVEEAVKRFGLGRR